MKDPRFTVFHADNPNFGMDKQPTFPQDYTKVAVVACPDLEAVFSLTNHIQKPWTENKEVIWHADRCRSTSVGDIVVTSDFEVWRVEGCGYKRLDK